MVHGALHNELQIAWPAGDGRATAGDGGPATSISAQIEAVSRECAHIDA
jgi:hypothetical protein